MANYYVSVGGSGGGGGNVSLASEAITIGAITTAPTKGTTLTDAVYYYVQNGVLFAHYEFDQTVAGTAGSGEYTFSLPNSYEINSSWVQADASDYKQATIGMGMITNHVLRQGSTTSHCRATVFSSTQFKIMYSSSATGSTPVSSTVFGLNTTIAFSINIQVPIAV